MLVHILQKEFVLGEQGSTVNLFVKDYVKYYNVIGQIQTNSLKEQAKGSSSLIQTSFYFPVIFQKINLIIIIQNNKKKMDNQLNDILQKVKRGVYPFHGFGKLNLAKIQDELSNIPDQVQTKFSAQCLNDCKILLEIRKLKLTTNELSKQQIRQTIYSLIGKILATFVIICIMIYFDLMDWKYAVLADLFAEYFKEKGTISSDIKEIYTLNKSLDYQPIAQALNYKYDVTYNLLIMKKGFENLAQVFGNQLN